LGLATVAPPHTSIRGAGTEPVDQEVVGIPAAVVEADPDDAALRLATRISHIGKDLLMANKQIVNKGLELMGRTLLQQIALEHDAIAPLAPEALEWRDSPFRT
jgi:hypothetical protein